jgi:Aminoglycoside-2''-adenylyltransferase
MKEVQDQKCPQVPKMPGRFSAECRGEHVIGVYGVLGEQGVNIWVHEGWGVDALLEQRTREHGDLDIAVEAKDLPKMLELSADWGYKEKGEEQARPWNFILQDQAGVRLTCTPSPLTVKAMAYMAQRRTERCTRRHP